MIQELLLVDELGALYLEQAVVAQAQSRAVRVGLGQLVRAQDADGILQLLGLEHVCSILSGNTVVGFRATVGDGGAVVDVAVAAAGKHDGVGSLFLFAADSCVDKSVAGCWG